MHPFRSAASVVALLSLLVLTACGDGTGTEPNEPPTAAVEAEVVDATMGETVTLDGTASTDPDGDELTYTWTQVAGPPVGTLSGPKPEFEAPDEVATLVFGLMVSDGEAESEAGPVTVRVWEDGDRLFFVAPGGSDDGSGTADRPFATVHAAIQAASQGRGDVYVAAGRYEGEPVHLATGVSLYGGFEAEGWTRDVGVHVSEIANTAGEPYGVIGADLSEVVVDGLTVRANEQPAPSGAVEGANSTGIYLSDAREVRLTNNRIFGGIPGTGLPGRPGGDGEPGKAGGRGGAARACPPGPSRGAPGGAGFTGLYAGGIGGQGEVDGGGRGGNGAGPAGGRGGAGGGVGLNGADGQVGGPGEDGAHGVGGAPGGPGGPGRSGSPGSGGGGGGGGGGGIVFACGGSGGGGGMGGPGGRAGGGGGGGGSSVGIVVVRSDVVIRGNEIVAAPGADGGTGGRGGIGGSGGDGGSGGARVAGQGAGGDGGDGGPGGRGGHGGGGGGGSSYGIWERDSNVVLQDNTFALGEPGQGGPALESNAGQPGEAVEHKVAGPDEGAP